MALLHGLPFIYLANLHHSELGKVSLEPCRSCQNVTSSVRRHIRGCYIISMRGLVWISWAINFVCICQMRTAGKLCSFLLSSVSYEHCFAGGVALFFWLLIDFSMFFLTLLFHTLCSFALTVKAEEMVLQEEDVVFLKGSYHTCYHRGLNQAQAFLSRSQICCFCNYAVFNIISD